MTRKIFLLCVCWMLGMSSELFAQPLSKADTTGLSGKKDVIDLLEKWFGSDRAHIDTTRLKRRVHFSVVPSAASVPGGGTAIATAFNAAFYLGDEKTTSLSTVTFTPWFSFDGKFVLPFRNAIWYPNDVLVSKGDTRFMIYPQYTWGLGGNTQQENKVLLEYNYIRFYHSVLRRAGRKILFGAGINVDYHYKAHLAADTFELSDIPFYDYRIEYNKKSTSIGPMLNILIDTRGNSLNPPGGVYAAIDYRFNAQFLGSTFDWQSILVDVRKYFPFETHRQNLLAFWGMYWGATNGRTPYLDLPSTGWDYYSRTARGFQQNRYRGTQLLYFESEYRRDITKDGFWGFVLFANIHSVSEYDTQQFAYWHAAVGAGVRVKFNKISRSNIGLDLAMSKDYTGVYITLGETF